MQALDVYSDRDDPSKIVFDDYFGRGNWFAVHRLVIKWNSTSVDKEIFGKVETDARLSPTYHDGKPQQLCVFTKAKNTTITDIQVVNPIYNSRSDSYGKVSSQRMFKSDSLHVTVNNCASEISNTIHRWYS